MEDDEQEVGGDVHGSGGVGADLRGFSVGDSRGGSVVVRGDAAALLACVFFGC